MSIKTNPDKKESAIADLKKYCENELDIEIGNLGSRTLYEYFEEIMSVDIYNQAVDDVKEWFSEKLIELSLDTALLYKEKIKK